MELIKDNIINKKALKNMTINLMKLGYLDRSILSMKATYVINKKENNK